jgi:hypothetical protein
MAKPRILISMFIAAPTAYGLGRLYRPYLGARVGAAIDLLLFVLITFICVKTFRRFEE